MLGFVFSILLVPLVTNIYVKADGPDAWQKKFLGFLGECKEEFAVTTEDMADLKNSKMPESEKVKCFFACTFKKADLMNEKGEFWVEGVRKRSLEHYGDDEALMKKIDEFIGICKKVNDVSVSDGEKGCERAALMYRCTVEHAHELGLV